MFYDFVQFPRNYRNPRVSSTIAAKNGALTLLIKIHITFITSGFPPFNPHSYNRPNIPKYLSSFSPNQLRISSNWECTLCPEFRFQPLEKSLFMSVYVTPVRKILNANPPSLQYTHNFNSVPLELITHNYTTPGVEAFI